jgi:hypothetical protein
MHRSAAQTTTDFAFADVRRALATYLAEQGFQRDCPDPGISREESPISVIIGHVA